MSPSCSGQSVNHGPSCLFVIWRCSPACIELTPCMHLPPCGVSFNPHPSQPRCEPQFFMLHKKKKKQQTLVSPLKQRGLGTQSLCGKQRFQRRKEEGIYTFQKATCKKPIFFSIPRSPQPFPPSGLPPPATLFSYFPLCSLSRFHLIPAEQCSNPLFPCLVSNQTLRMFSPSQGLIRVVSYTVTLGFLRGAGVLGGCFS